MIHDIIQFVSSLNLSPEITILVTPYSQKGFDWVPFASAALGGAASIAASLLAFKAANKAEKDKIAEKDKKDAATLATVGYLKLMHSVNLLGNIRIFMDDSFEESYREGVDGNEAYLYIKPAVGKFTEPDRLKPEEFMFLIDLNQVSLINDLYLVEQSAINTHEILEKYSITRAAFDAWTDDIPGIQRELDGAKRIDKIPISYKPIYDTKIAQLNLLISAIIEDLDEDIENGIKRLEMFSSLAHQVYKPYFHDMKISIRPRRYYKSRE